MRHSNCLKRRSVSSSFCCRPVDPSLPRSTSCCLSRRCSFWKRRTVSSGSCLSCRSLSSCSLSSCSLLSCSSLSPCSFLNRRSLSSRSCLSLSRSYLSIACSNLSSATCPASLATFRISSALCSYISR